MEKKQRKARKSRLGTLLHALSKPEDLDLVKAAAILNKFVYHWRANGRQPLDRRQKEEVFSNLAKEMGKPRPVIKQWTVELKKAAQERYSLKRYFKEGRPLRTGNKVLA